MSVSRKDAKERQRRRKRAIKWETARLKSLATPASEPAAPPAQPEK